MSSRVASSYFQSWTFVFKETAFWIASNEPSQPSHSPTIGSRSTTYCVLLGTPVTDRRAQSQSQVPVHAISRRGNKTTRALHRPA